MANTLGRMVTKYNGFLSLMLLYPLITFFAESRDKLKSLYLHYHNIYGHKIWQDSDLP